MKELHLRHGCQIKLKMSAYIQFSFDYLGEYVEKIYVYGIYDKTTQKFIINFS